MEIVQKNIFWLLLIVIIVAIIIYKITSKDPEAITSKYRIEKNFEPTPDLKQRIIWALDPITFNTAYFDEKTGQFHARTPMSMCSWGENITISFAAENSKTVLCFSSVCAFEYQIFAWQKNKRNFKEFWKNLENQDKPESFYST